MVWRNGEIPYSVVSVVLASGTDSNGYWEFRCTPAFAARWYQAKRNAERMFGRTIYIRTGWNVYRPYLVQVQARDRACASGNCNGAAYEGTSSHGGEWGGRPCLAVDVDPNGLTWDQVDQAMEAAGFSARLITEAMSGIRGGERWHYIDFNAFGAIPAGFNATPFLEDDMPTMNEFLNTPAYDGGPTISQFFKNVDQGGIATQVWWASFVDRAGVKIPVIQEVADAKTVAMEIAGRPVADANVEIDNAALAAALVPSLAPLLAAALAETLPDGDAVDVDAVAAAVVARIDAALGNG